MKTLTLIYLIPLLALSQIKQGIIIYSIDMDILQKNIDKDRLSMNPQKYEYLSKIFDASNDIRFKLIFNEKYALFHNIETLNIGEETAFKKLCLIFSSGNQKYYSDLHFKKQIIVRANNINMESTINKNEWKLSRKTKKIGDFICYKATTMKSVPRDFLVKAWYTPDIPIALGPNNRVGELPGLILELHDSTVSYYAKEIKLNPKKKIVIKWPKNGKSMTEKEYKEAGDKALKNFRDSN